MVIFPALGIVLGASCCLSVPILVTVAAPSAAVLSSSLWLYDATYFLFPPAAVILLYLNLYSVGRITANAKLRTGGAGQAIPSAGPHGPEVGVAEIGRITTRSEGL